MIKSVTQLIQLAQGDRGRLTQILVRQQSGEALHWVATDWLLLAHELQRLGCFAQVLELSDIADSVGVNDFNLLAKAATAAANLGLSGTYVAKLERAIATLPESASPEVVEEVLGGLGRQYKDRALQAEDDAERERLLQKSLDAYASAYRRTSRLWSGVNVAAVSLLLGDESRANILAKRLSLDASARFKQSMTGALDEEPHWLKAIEAECALILGRIDDAAGLYRSARSLADRRLGDVASMRRQARLLLRRRAADPDLASQWMPPPRIVAFSGHRAALPERPSAPSPVANLLPLATAISRWLIENQACIAVCSLLADADLLFAEAALRISAELHIVLPVGRRGLEQMAMIDAVPEGRARVARVLAAATSVRELSPDELVCDAVDFVYLNEMLLGTAEILKQAVDGDVRGLAVWDDRAGDGPGGAVDAVRSMVANGWPVTRIDPQAAIAERVTRVPEATAAFLSVRSQLKALLFGDFVGFSKLGRAGLLDFRAQVLATVGHLVDALPATDAPCELNTWGDALYVAFPSVNAAARFALQVQAALARLGATQGGVARAVRLRLALHYGPTLEALDPVTKRINVIGTHVSRAARLEPATAPGEVYASEAFASRLLLERGTGLDCRYLKNMPWAKNYGVFPTFRLSERAT